MIEMYFDFRLFRLWKSRQHSKLLDYDDLLWLCPAPVGLLANYLTSEPTVWWQGVWLSASEMLFKQLVAKLEKQRTWVFFCFWRDRVVLAIQPAVYFFLTYLFSLSAYLSENGERETGKKDSSSLPKCEEKEEEELDSRVQWGCFRRVKAKNWNNCSFLSLEGDRSYFLLPSVDLSALLRWRLI